MILFLSYVDPNPSWEKHAYKYISDYTYTACVNGFCWQLQCVSHLIGMSTFPFALFVFVCGS